MSEIFRPSIAEIDLSAVQANFLVLRGFVDPAAFFCPMIKANAYGHGDREVANALRIAGARHLGVALIEEGIKLRKNGDREDLLVFGVFSDEVSAQAMIDHELTTVLSDWSQLDALEKVALKSTLKKAKPKVHLKFNTGMNRLGFAIEEAPRLRERFANHSSLELEGVCTHLLRGDDAGVAQGDSQSQFVQFAKVMSAFRGLKVHAHALNSGGTVGVWKRALSQEGLRKEEVGPLGARPGISIYGVQAAADPALAVDLKPVMSLKSRIVLTKKVAKGDVVSYGATWRADRPSLIGVIPFGYADGWARALSNKGSVLCRGQRVPIAGIVCMDYFMVDLTDVADLKAPVQNGEEVVLIGEQKGQRILAEDVAQMTGTIAYEVLTRVSDRVPRRFIGASYEGAAR